MPGTDSNLTSARYASPEERRRQLTDAAIEAIAEVGLARLTVAEVTQRAGLSVGIVAQQFGGKENLLRATLQYLAESVRDVWFPIYCATDLPPQERLTRLADSLFDPSICNRAMIASWFAFFGDAHFRAVYREIVGGFDNERADAFAEICAELVAAGGYDDINPGALADAIETMADGLWLSILLYPRDITPGVAIAQVRDLLARSFPGHVARCPAPACKERGE